jgi:hypothetical protein
MFPQKHIYRPLRIFGGHGLGECPDGQMLDFETLTPETH